MGDSGTSTWHKISSQVSITGPASASGSGGDRRAFVLFAVFRLRLASAPSRFCRMSSSFRLVSAVRRPAEDVHGFRLRAGQDSGLDGRIIVAQFVGGTAMRKREDVHAIGVALDYTAISPVADTFNWIGQRLAIIAIGVGEDGGDGHRAELGIIELNDDAGPQDTFAP